MNEWILTLINCTVTTLVDILTISSWFGIWTLQDHIAHLITEDRTVSSIFSLVRNQSDQIQELKVAQFYKCHPKSSHDSF